MLIDNKTDRNPSSGLNIKTIWDFILTYSGKNSGSVGALDIVTGYFTIYALSKLADEIPAENHFRIISSEMIGEDCLKDQIVNLLSDTIDLTAIGNIDVVAQKAIEFLERPTVEMRAAIPDFCHGKAYLFGNNNPSGSSYYVSGSSNLTPAGLGLKAAANIELNLAEACNKSNNEWKELKAWYEDTWTSALKEIPEDITKKRSPKVPVKEYFIRKIKEYFRTYTPEEIYYKILFELFNNDLDLDAGIEHRQDMSLLQTSAIWNTLYNYQQKGVISLIKMLRKYNGAILADAVGLGKTFSALAVMKYFQTQGYMTILFCPKKLENNWTQYLRHYGSQFDRDDFDYKVRFHTDLQDDRLLRYEDASLEYLQDRKKLLLVIDESHNLRNEQSGRYKELVDCLIKKKSESDNRDVKVLMLSATPINTGLKDIKGQFNLIGRGADNAFDNDEFGIESMRNLFADGQKKYTEWCKDDERTIGGFISMLPQKFFGLTDKLIVARTRKMIENTLGEKLHFPAKEKPINIYQGVDHFGEYATTDEIYAAFEELRLTAYQPSKYMKEAVAKPKEGDKLDWQDDIYREQFLVKMMGVLFMKRLESSWYACMLTVKNVLDVHEKTLAKVVAFNEHKKDASVDVSVEEFDDDQLENFALTRKKDVIRLADMKNIKGFEEGLRLDIRLLRKIYNNLKNYESDYTNKIEKDLKLNELERILKEKQESANKKVVVFTVYADTANFIYDELYKRGFRKMGVATGRTVRSTGNHSTRDYLDVLQSFAPYSKLYKEKDWSVLYDDAKLPLSQYYNDEKQRWEVPYELWRGLLLATDKREVALLNDEIDILIATDCLSEGQNLQDADMQINYDIHWNPVRLIQRFGRIDRIGSPCDKIRSVNFWPAKSFEDYLNLETRIVNRMAIMELSGAETQEINEKYIKMVEDNPIQDKNSDRLLRELQNNSISDVESAQTLSLKDFSFETFRQDLLEFFEKHKETFQKMPNAIFSGFMLPDEQREQMPESLVAVVGYPHRDQGGKKAYESIYLMCQPVDTNLPAQYKELNQAEVLDFLRKNKKAERFVPEWIEASDSKKMSQLSAVLKDWMGKQANHDGRAIINELFTSRKPISQNQSLTINVDSKFKLQNFDLIVWEYISR